MHSAAEGDEASVELTVDGTTSRPAATDVEVAGDGTGAEISAQT